MNGKDITTSLAADSLKTLRPTEEKKELSILVQSTKILAVTESNASSVNLGTPESQILFNNFKDSLIEILKEKLNILESQFEKL